MSRCSIILLTVTIVTIASAAPKDPPEAIVKFTPKLYQQSIASYPGDNIVSPFTAWNVLVLLSQAAKANTYQQLVTGLGIKNNKAKTAKQIPKFYEDLQDDAGSAELTIFNEIFLQKGYKLNQAFRKVAINKFGAGIQKVNFTEARNGSPGYPAGETINNFVQGKTNNTIQDVVRTIGDRFSADTRAVLVNGAYFSGEWARPFDPSKSYWGSFNGLPHPYMTTLDVFNHADLPDLSASAVELEYADSDYSLVIVMPNLYLSGLETSLKTYDWSKITKKMRPKYVNLTVPRFRSYLQFALNSGLSNLGMTDMFSNAANLKGFLESPERLKIFHVQHSSSIRLDEDHAEIASGSGIHPNAFVLAADPTCEPVTQFNANRPFVYYLRNRIDDTIIFSGRLVRPVLG